MKYESNDTSVKFLAENMAEAYQIGRVFSKDSSVDFNLFLDHVDNGVWVSIEYDQLFKMLLNRKNIHNSS